jgi:hypothetical protein
MIDAICVRRAVQSIALTARRVDMDAKREQVRPS